MAVLFSLGSIISIAMMAGGTAVEFVWAASALGASVEAADSVAAAQHDANAWNVFYSYCCYMDLQLFIFDGFSSLVTS